MDCHTSVAVCDVQVECGSSTDPVGTGDATASDTCGAASLTYSSDTTFFRYDACPTVETITRTWTATATDNWIIVIISCIQCGNDDGRPTTKPPPPVVQVYLPTTPPHHHQPPSK
jgi:hypothetical protein